MGIWDPGFTLTQSQSSGIDDDGEAYPILGHDDAPTIVSSLLIGHAFLSRPSSLVYKEVSIARNYNLHNVQYDKT